MIAGAALAAISFGASAATITSSSGFVNTSIATQTGTFTATFDATPSVSPANDVLSFSSGAQSAYTGMAASVRFSITGTIDARNGGAYAAATSIPFSAGSNYHFRMVINVASHIYSAYVTPPGGSELTIASNYAFRTEQAGITSINNFDANVNSSPGGSLTYTTPTITGSSSSSSSVSSSVSSSSSSVSSVSSSSSSVAGTTITSSNGFVNSAVANQTGTFTATFDGKPSVSPANDTLSFSSGAQSAYTGLAATVRFNTTGTIDARNGAAYAAVTNVPFSANSNYHFRMVINVATKTYSAYVTAPGGSEQTIATNYAFRTEQAGITNINNFDANVNSAPGGSLTFTLPVITGSSSSSVSSSSSSSSVSSSSSSSSVSSSSSSSSVSSSSASSTSSLGAVRYRQVFDALPTGVLWAKNLDSAKPTAHPENALVTAGCGTGGSTCLRIVYRHPDGIHKQPISSPVFSGSGSSIIWTPSDSAHTNTATDVEQQNLPIDGKTDGTSTKTGTAIPSKAYTLSYDVYFEPGFDFAKGGKLPGLAAAAFDSGCTEDGNVKRSNTNWSERIMWRANGRVELYSYDQSRLSGSCGVDKMIDAVAGDPPYEVPGQIPNDNKFRFQPGVWYTIRLAVKVNDNNAVTYQKDASGNVMKDPFGDPFVTGGNGEVSLAIKSADGSVKRLLVFPNMAVRDECNGSCPSTVPDSKATWVNAFFFSTFFGGNEVKRTTCLSTTPPSYPGLTQSIYDTLCTSQRIAYIFPTITWNPQRPSAAHFDNFTVTDGYTNVPF